jgi:hypothetical protein
MLSVEFSGLVAGEIKRHPEVETVPVTGASRIPINVCRNHCIPWYLGTLQHILRTRSV